MKMSIDGAESTGHIISQGAGAKKVRPNLGQIIWVGLHHSAVWATDDLPSTIDTHQVGMGAGGRQDVAEAAQVRHQVRREAAQLQQVKRASQKGFGRLHVERLHEVRAGGALSFVH